DGYARRAPPPARGDLALHTAAALFSLAPHFFRERDPRWPERTEVVLDRVESVLPGRASARAAGRRAFAGNPPTAPAGNGDPARETPVRPGKLADVCKMLPRITERVVLNE